MTSEELIIELEALGFKNTTDWRNNSHDLYSEVVRKNAIVFLGSKRGWRLSFKQGKFYHWIDYRSPNWNLIDDNLSLESMLLLYKDMQ